MVCHPSSQTHTSGGTRVEDKSSRGITFYLHFLFFAVMVTGMISSVIVLGDGSAGLLTALTLKRRLPRLNVRFVRSADNCASIVGETSTADLPRHLFECLALKPQSFYQEVEPSWKIGTRFHWGARKQFNYSLAAECQKRQPPLSRCNGFYYNDDYPWLGLSSAFMAHDKVFSRQPNGLPQFHNRHGFHIETSKLSAWLENRCREQGIEITNASVKPEKGGEGIAALISDTGERITADLYVDAAGFRSELLGVALAEPYQSYSDSLFCDRAVIGGWPRTTEPILSYTTVETMDAGWSWRIEHERSINCGYVYSSQFISDEAALEEFQRKNPQIVTPTHVVKFQPGRYNRCWVGNVVSVGDASGFVEPLEATAITLVCSEAGALADALLDSLQEPTPTLKKLYNKYCAELRDDLRNFLAVHYKFNTLLDTPFWRACRSDAAIHHAENILDWYRENGPSFMPSQVLLPVDSAFGLGGYFTILVGMNVPYDKRDLPPSELEIWRHHCLNLGTQARLGMSVREALDAIRAPGSNWA
jgi:tryptophan halogenase